VQAPLEQRQRFQQLFFPEGMAFDGSVLLEPRTARAFSYLPGLGHRRLSAAKEMVDLTGIEPVTS
jgi:hypothetical protein